jgi:Ca-activated chloride channel family protein
MAEFVVGLQSAGQHRLARFELKTNIPALNRSAETMRHEMQLSFSQDPPDEPVPPALLSALAKIAIFKMQDNAWKAMEKGNVSEATRRLEMMATRLLDLGEHHLARAALLEAGRLARSGHLSPAGRKTIKYGTRSLSLSSKERGND